MSRSLKNQVQKKLFFEAEKNVCRCLGEEVPVRQDTSFSQNFRDYPLHYYNEVWEEIYYKVYNHPSMKTCDEFRKQVLRRSKY
jgi:hypothetical protein